MRARKSRKEDIAREIDERGQYINDGEDNQQKTGINKRIHQAREESKKLINTMMREWENKSIYRREKEIIVVDFFIATFVCFF